MARRLWEWTHAFLQDPTDLPKHEYGKFNASILEDEPCTRNFSSPSKGKYVCAMDIVRFLDTAEMKERLNLKKSISERMARRWMNKMGYHWKKEPKGQYKDGHEREDVVAYRQNVFLPFISGPGKKPSKQFPSKPRDQVNVAQGLLKIHLVQADGL